MSIGSGKSADKFQEQTVTEMSENKMWLRLDRRSEAGGDHGEPRIIVGFKQRCPEENYPEQS
jgi:hypothetical protein